MTVRPSLTVSHPTACGDMAEVQTSARPRLTPDALEAFLRARPPAVPVLGIEALDGYLTALLIGPKFIDPRVWLGRLLGEDALLAAADTQAHFAVQAVAEHHNRLSETLSQYPYRYRPRFTSHRLGGLDPLFWGLGFAAGVALAARAWTTVTDPRKPGHALFAPLDCAVSGPGPIPDRAVPTVAKAVLDLREHFKARRYRSMR